MVRVIASATMLMVGLSDCCSSETNSAPYSPSLMFCRVTVSCVEVGISHHPVSVGLRVAMGSTPAAGCGQRRRRGGDQPERSGVRRAKVGEAGQQVVVRLE